MDRKWFCRSGAGFVTKDKYDMLYNIVLTPVNKDYHHYGVRLTGYDDRPLRFTEKKYAEREAYELNLMHKNRLEATNLVYLVVENYE